jgi:hypothetical protein
VSADASSNEPASASATSSVNQSAGATVAATVNQLVNVSAVESVSGVRMYAAIHRRLYRRLRCRGVNRRRRQ